MSATSSMASPDTEEMAGTSESSELDEFEDAVPDASRDLEPHSALSKTAGVHLEVIIYQILQQAANSY